MNSNIKKLLFAVIRSGMEISDLDNHISTEEMKELCAIAKAQAILPIFVRGIKRSSVQPASIPPEYEKIYLKDTYRSVQFEDALRKIIVVFNENRIPFVLLKGAVLRDLYPDVYMRTSCDLDILVREDDLDRAVSTIESSTAFKVYARGYHDVAMINSQVKLELHFSIKENMEKIDVILDRVWDYSTPASYGYQYNMSTEFQVFYVLAHMSYHLTHGGVGIRPLLDLWLIDKVPCDRTKLKTMLVNTGTSVLYEKCLRLVDAWMENRKTDYDLVDLEDFCLAGGVFGNSETAALAQVRKQSKAVYLFRRLFARREYLEELYPKLKNRPYLLPIYQIKRWFRLADKHRRKKAQQEFEVAISAGQKEKESVDVLLKSLGL